MITSKDAIDYFKISKELQYDTFGILQKPLANSNSVSTLYLVSFLLMTSYFSEAGFLGVDVIKSKYIRESIQNRK